MDKQIRAAFSLTNNLTDEIVNKISSLCEVYDLSPEELSNEWDAYSFNQGNIDINVDSIEDFRINVLQKRIEEKNDKKTNTPFKKHSNEMNVDSQTIFNNNSIENLDYVVAGISRKPGNINKIPVFNSNNSFKSPSRNSQNFRSTIKSPTSSGLFSPTKHRKVDKSEEISSHTKKFNERQKRGELEVVLNKDIPKPSIDTDISKEVSVELINEDQQINCYRYMFSKLDDISSILNNRIDEISNLILERNNIEYFTPPQIISPDEFITAGRLCTDVLDIMDSMNTKTNDRSYILETSQSTGSGHRIKLNFSKLSNDGKEYTIFPGQIVGIKGTNATGNCLDVTEIIEPPPLRIPATNIMELSQYYGNGKQQPISVFVASGPYTCEDSLEYEPYNELFDKYILPQKPDVLILMGPFVDDRHPLIMDGETDLFPEDIFKEYISPKINEFYQNSPHSTIILIPSLNDIISESLCFPQPPLDSSIVPHNEQFSIDSEEIYLQKVNDAIIRKRNVLGLPKDLFRVKCFPNPVQFQINDVIFAVSNNDIISHMYNEEFYRPSRSSGLGSPFKGSDGSNHRPMDRISRLTRHLFQQHSLYPLFPPALHKANINYEHSKGFYLTMKPDVLILNSAVRLFAKTIDDVVCVNPGQVVHKIVGTFSKFYIYPMDLSKHMKEIKREEGLAKVKKEEDNKHMDVDQINIVHEVSKRCRVEIQRV